MWHGETQAAMFYGGSIVGIMPCMEEDIVERTYKFMHQATRVVEGSCSYTWLKGLLEKRFVWA